MEIVSCIKIKSDGKILQEKLVFDLTDIKNKDIRRIELLNNMKKLVGCGYYIGNVAKSNFPSESFYHAIFQGDSPSSNKPLNKIATHIINYIYNNDSSNLNNYTCYGDCYILHLDSDIRLWDTSLDTFINLYNKVHTSTEGIREREYFNRIYKEGSQCYLYNDFKNRKY